MNLKLNSDEFTIVHRSWETSAWTHGDSLGEINPFTNSHLRLVPVPQSHCQEQPWKLECCEVGSLNSQLKQTKLLGFETKIQDRWWDIRSKPGLKIKDLKQRKGDPILIRMENGNARMQLYREGRWFPLTAWQQLHWPQMSLASLHWTYFTLCRKVFHPTLVPEQSTSVGHVPIFTNMHWCALGCPRICVFTKISWPSEHSMCYGIT